MDPKKVRLLQNPPELQGWELGGIYRNETLYFDGDKRLILMVGPDAYEISLDMAQQWAANRDVELILANADDLPDDVRSAYGPVMVAEYPDAGESLFMDSGRLVLKVGDTFTDMTHGEAREWAARRGVALAARDLDAD